MRHSVLVQTWVAWVDGSGEDAFALREHEEKVRKREEKIQGMGAVIINSTTAISYVRDVPATRTIYLTTLLVEEGQASE